MKYTSKNLKFEEFDLDKDWTTEHDFELNYPRVGDVFDRCHQRFTNNKEWLFGMFGKWHAIKEIYLIENKLIEEHSVEGL